MWRFVVIFLVYVCGLAQGANYCCYPPAWESLNFFRTGGLVNGTLTSSSGEEMISVDTSKNFVNSMATITSSGQTTSVRTIQDWGNEKQYIIIGQNCAMSALMGPYPNKCVPDDAKMVSDIAFGVTKPMPVQVFQIMRNNVTVFLDVVKPDCTPMAVSAFGSMNGGGQGMSVKLYTNFTLGVKDPSVFTIPSICMQGPTQRPPIHGGLMHGIF